MISFAYALLTLAAGMLVGSAAAILSKKQLSISTVIGWGGTVILLAMAFAFGVWTEMQVHPNSLSKPLSTIIAAAIVLYGTFCGIAWINRAELWTMKDPGKRIWITAAAAKIWLSIPPVLWPIFILLAPWNAYTSLVFAIGLGIVVATFVWLVFNFVWILHYGFKKEIKNPASL